MEKLENICCICGHTLHEHFEEEKWFRCHAIGTDCYQCECRIIKDLETPLEDYDYIKRKFNHIKELTLKAPENLIKNFFVNKEEECLYFVQNYLDKNPEILHNKLRIKNTRIPVSLILELEENNLSISEVLEEYPSLSEEIVKKVYEFKDYLKKLI